MPFLKQFRGVFVNLPGGVKQHPDDAPNDPKVPPKLGDLKLPCKVRKSIQLKLSFKVRNTAQNPDVGNKPRDHIIPKLNVWCPIVPGGLVNNGPGHQDLKGTLCREHLPNDGLNV
jgi:hypothetical protein